MSNNIIHAEPTKELFIGMLTRDVPINRAILDLIDNSIDGAIRLKADGTYDDLIVEITIEDDYFEIKDNCGGINLDIAMEYAFRFGRPTKTKILDNSIGRFGIGMKRSLFKIGDHFKVLSYTDDINFYIEVDVDVWKNQKRTATIDGVSIEIDNWDFDFYEIDDVDDSQENGTKIKVSKLNENIAGEFSDPYFVSNFMEEVSLAHSIAINNGLTILVNGERIKPESFMLKIGDSINPIYKTITYSEDSWDDDVTIKLYAGIAERDINKGGWYIFCNNRLVVDADRSDITGWKDKEQSLPKYHADYAYFRGYLFFESKDAGLLPWTTTKTGLNSDSLVYRKAYFEMTKAMDQVIATLKDRKNQKSMYDKGELSTKPMDDIIESSTLKSIFDISNENEEYMFESVAPEIAEVGERRSRIQYSRLEEDIQILKDELQVSTNYEVGEITFDYYLGLVKED